MCEWVWNKAGSIIIIIIIIERRAPKPQDQAASGGAGGGKTAVCTGDRVEAHLQRLRLHLSAHEVAAMCEVRTHGETTCDGIGFAQWLTREPREVHVLTTGRWAASQT